MSNMSYCKFQNTDHDLDDCFDDLERRVQGEGVDENGDPIELLSDREVRAAMSLILKAVDLVNLVMEDRGLNEIDEVTDNEVLVFLESLQEDVEEAEARRRADDEETDRAGAEIDDGQPMEGGLTYDPPAGMPRPKGD